MPAQLNHTIVHARDRRVSAEFLAEMLDLDAPAPFGHFLVVQTGNEVSLDFIQVGDGDEVLPQHYAFLVSEEQFDATYGRIVERAMPHWADPGRSSPGEINHHDGGRGVYFLDPSGHFLEIITRPYGSGG